MTNKIKPTNNSQPTFHRTPCGKFEKPNKSTTSTTKTCVFWSNDSRMIPTSTCKNPHWILQGPSKMSPWHWQKTLLKKIGLGPCGLRNSRAGERSVHRNKNGWQKNRSTAAIEAQAHRNSWVGAASSAREWNMSAPGGEQMGTQVKGSLGARLSGEPGHGRNRARKDISQEVIQFPDHGTRAESKKNKWTNAIASSSKKARHDPWIFYDSCTLCKGNILYL
jgi:hypothetical protein